MLLALEVAKEGDTLEARGSLQRSLDARPEVVRFLHVPEGNVTSVAFGPEGKIAAGYGVGVGGVGGVVLFDARGERLRPAPLEVKEGDVTSVAFGPEGKIAAGYGVARRRRRRGALRRPGRAAPTRAAGGQGGRCHERGLRAGGQDRRGIWRRRRRRRGALRRPGRAAPTRAAGGQGGQVTSVAFGPEGQIAAGYGVGGAAAWCSSTPGASGSDPAAGGQGGRCQRAWPSGRRADRRGIGAAAGGVVLFDARGERLRPPRDMASRRPSAAAWCSSTPGASGSDPRRWRSRRAMSRAWPSGRRARSPRDMRRRRRRRRRGALRRPGRAAPTRAAGGQGGRCQERGLRAGGQDRRGIWRRRRRRRRGALRRPGRAAPTHAAGGQGGRCHERGLRAGGPDRRGIWRRVGGGGVVLFDADPASWRRKAGQTPTATSRGSSGRGTSPRPPTAARSDPCPGRMTCPRPSGSRPRHGRKSIPRGERPHDTTRSETKNRPGTFLGSFRRGWSFPRLPQSAQIFQVLRGEKVSGTGGEKQEPFLDKGRVTR